MTDAKQKSAAKAFAEYWKNKGYEKGESHAFWLSLLREVFGVSEPEKLIRFEDQVKLDKSTGFIDGFIAQTHVMIEQKGADKELNRAIKQSDGSLLTPFQQAKRYSAELPYSDRPRWIVTCNCREFYVYDMEKPLGEPEKIKLSDLEKEKLMILYFSATGNSKYVAERIAADTNDHAVSIETNPRVALFSPPMSFRASVATLAWESVSPLYKRNNKMKSLSEQNTEQDNVINQAKNFVKNFSLAVYLRSHREKVKAELGVSLAVFSPDRVFTTMKELIDSVQWGSFTAANAQFELLREL